VLICPGGGYWDLYWQLEGGEVAAWLNSIGATGIILKYRVPRRPDEIKDEIAPGLRIPAGTPPVFLAHGGADIISPPEHSVLMYLALRKAGVPAELHIYATAAHDFGVRPSDHPCSTWTQACANWLRHQGFLKPPTQAR
jgi:acetyl esterase/lipase